MNGRKKIVKASSYFLYIFGMTCFLVIMDLGIPWAKLYPLIVRHIIPTTIIAVIVIELGEYLNKKGLEVTKRQSQDNH